MVPASALDPDPEAASEPSRSLHASGSSSYPESFRLPECIFKTLDDFECLISGLEIGQCV
jgi:hypothetical protein